MATIINILSWVITAGVVAIYAGIALCCVEYLIDHLRRDY